MKTFKLPLALALLCNLSLAAYAQGEKAQLPAKGPTIYDLQKQINVLKSEIAFKEKQIAVKSYENRDLQREIKKLRAQSAPEANLLIAKSLVDTRKAIDILRVQNMALASRLAKMQKAK